MLQPIDVTITRTLKKSIFGFRRWLPCKQWVQCHEHTVVSTVGSCNAVAEVVFGYLDIRLLLDITTMLSNCVVTGSGKSQIPLS